MENSDNVCLYCGKRYTRFHTLRRHLKESHPDEIDIAPLPDRKYKCTHCQKQYNTKQYLNLHLRKAHTEVFVKPIKASYNCPLCNYNDSQKTALLKHFEDLHKIVLEVEEHTFSTHSDFIIWKETIEIMTLSKFICRSGSQFKRLTQFIYYICHRSGKYKSEGQGLRHLKRQGSKKIGGFCPAALRVSITQESVKVQYTKTHVGHQNDVSHSSLSNSERQCIVEKIATDVPFDAILDEAHQHASLKQEVKRLHMLTKHELHNIKNNYSICENEKTAYQNSNLLSTYIGELHNRDKSILLYKPEGVLIDEVPQLEVDDFILIIMNEAQKNMLKLYGSSVVCIDRTHSLNEFKLEFIVLNVLDDLKEGLPCAFLICSRCDEEILKIFFKSICAKTGVITPDTFISDTSELFYKTFIAVMNPPKTRLFCPWHVDHCWKKNLVTIPSKEKQIEIYKSLETLLLEKNVDVFENKLSDFTNKLLLDPETLDFGMYFVKIYSYNSKSWALSYVSQNAWNMMGHFERLHKSLSFIYFYSRNTGRMDKMLEMLLKFLNSRINDLLNYSLKERIEMKLSALQRRHKLSLKLGTAAVAKEDNSWNIKFEGYTEANVIQQNSLSCNCNLRCLTCEFCIHRFTCNCIDSSIKWNMCKHIHFLCNSLFAKPYQNTSFKTLKDGSFIDDAQLSNAFALFSQESTSTEVINDSNKELSNVFITISGSTTSGGSDYQTLVNNVQSNSSEELSLEIQNLTEEFINVFSKIATNADYLIAKNHLLALKSSLQVLETKNKTADLDKDVTQNVLSNGILIEKCVLEK